MKKLLLLSLLALAGCASDPVFQPITQKGTACMPQKDNKVVCTPVRLYTDPTRFYYVRPWESLGEMPDLP